MSYICIMKKTYKIYGLIDPRTNKICYIGYTTQLLKTRLLQHLNPIPNNLSKIAKLHRYLKRNGLKLSIIEICNCKNEEEMYEKEIFYISHFKNIGYDLKNIQKGGKITINEEESYLKSKRTRLKNKKNYTTYRGENSPISLLTNNEVINIYNLIKKGYNNEDIYKFYNDKCTLSVIKAIRSGQNWKELFDINMKEFIPSIKSSSNECYTGYQKVKIVDLISKNYELCHIHKWFNKISKSDLKRIKNKIIWNPVWKVYKQISAYNK